MEPSAWTLMTFIRRYFFGIASIMHRMRITSGSSPITKVSQISNNFELRDIMIYLDEGLHMGKQSLVERFNCSRS